MPQAIKILADASLPVLDKAFPAPFELQLYHQAEEIPSLLQNHSILLCRSTLKVNQTLLENNSSLEFVATASSGVDHIDTIYLQDQNISLVDAKGSNAGSVAEYILSCLAYLQNNQLLKSKQAGLIGLGAVGTQVYQRLKSLGFEVVVHDPLKADFMSSPLEKIAQADLICIHANLHDTLPFPSRGLLNAAFLKLLKPNTILINAARGHIVDELALLALEKPLIYCTDVYANEPNIAKEIVTFASLCTPHIAGHSIDAKHAAIYALSRQLHQAYKLKLLDYSLPAPKSTFLLQENWSKQFLSAYNPLHETQALKKADNIQEAFLNLRKAHTRKVIVS